MKKKVIKITVVLSVLMCLTAIICLLDGCFKNYNYNKNSLTCEVTITNLKTTEDFDGESTDYHHVYYGQYSADNKSYENIVVLKTITVHPEPDHSIGEKISIRVNRDNPECLAETGFGSLAMGFASIGCALLIIFLGLFIYRHIREPINSIEK